MEAELARLEEKVNQLARVCIDLRTENQSLRQQVLNERADNQRLQQKLEGAVLRTEAILAKLPEESR